MTGLRARQMTRQELADFRKKIDDWERKGHGFLTGQNQRYMITAIADCCRDLAEIIIDTSDAYKYLPGHIRTEIGRKSIEKMVQRGLLFIAGKSNRCRIIRLRMPGDPLWFNSFTIDDNLNEPT